MAQQVPLYIGTEDVRGTVHLKRSKGKKIDLDHNGCKIELIGQVRCIWRRFYGV